MDDTNDQSFSAAFAEFSGQPAAAPDPVVVPPAEPEASPAAIEETQQTTAAPAQPETPPEGNADPVTTPDIWANAPAELRSAFEAERTAREEAEQRYRSREGRETAFQRNLHQLRRQLKAVTGSLAGQDDPVAFLETDEWKKAKADYGDDDLKPLFETMEKMAQRQKALGETLGEVGQSLAAEDTGGNFEVLDQQAPDWKTLFARDDFNSWLEKQPKMFRDSMAEQWKELTDPASVVEVANRYRRDLVLQGAIQVEPTPEAPAAAQPTTPDPRRAVQLDGARTASVSTPPAGDPASSFSDFFQQAAKAKEAQLARH